MENVERPCGSQEDRLGMSKCRRWRVRWVFSEWARCRGTQPLAATCRLSAVTSLAFVPANSLRNTRWAISCKTYRCLVEMRGSAGIDELAFPGPQIAGPLREFGACRAPVRELRFALDCGRCQQLAPCVPAWTSNRCATSLAASRSPLLSEPSSASTRASLVRVAAGRAAVIPRLVPVRPWR